MTRVALTIAGSDPSGGAGIQADLKTFHQHGVYGTSVLTLLTVQNTCNVTRVQVQEPGFVLEQLDAVLEDVPPAAAKTGALGSAAVVEAVALRAAKLPGPLVVDPVMISKHGAPLMDAEARAMLAHQLLPHATVVTPNVHEAAFLSQREITDVESARNAAKAIAGLGARAVIVKGGHLHGDPIDVLWHDEEIHELSAPRVDTKHTHGTGCAYSSALTSHLAQDASLPDAAQRAKDWLTEALRTAPGIGAGIGPPNYHASLPRWR